MIVGVSWMLQAPIHFRLVDAEPSSNVSVQILSEFFFSTTAGLVFQWRLLLNGLAARLSTSDTSPSLLIDDAAAWESLPVDSIPPQARPADRVCIPSTVFAPAFAAGMSARVRVCLHMCILGDCCHVHVSG